MNPLTLVKRIQKINSAEASLGISDEASWHAKYKDSAYVFVGGIPFQLTEGDLLAVFAQYGEIVDVNLVRDKGTGKSKGFAFLAYEDQRSTTLAVDNLNGAKVLGRIVRVDHVSNYRRKKEEEEDGEEEKQKREARGVCYAFQRGECDRGAACRFSHDQQRNANTGARDVNARWEHDRSEGSPRTRKRLADVSFGQHQERHQFDERRDEAKYATSHEGNGRSSRDDADEAYHRHHPKHKIQVEQRREKQPEKFGRETRLEEERDVHSSERRSSRHHHTESYPEDDRETGGSAKQSVHSCDRRSSRHHPTKSRPEDDPERGGSEKRSAHSSDRRFSRHHHTESRLEDDRERGGSVKRSVHDQGSSCQRHREGKGGHDHSL